MDFLLPSNQNNIQKVGLFITIALLIAVVFIHNPFSGYEWCGSENGATVLTENTTAYFECKLETFFGYVEPWYTLGTQKPFIYWFSTISHVLLSMLTIVAVGVSWLLIFKSPSVTNTVE